MDALLIAPAVALSFAAILLLGKALLYALLAVLERGSRIVAHTGLTDHPPG